MLRLLKLLLAGAAGLTGLCVGAFLGAAASRFASGSGGLHGFDTIQMLLIAAGAIAGLLAGVRGGSIAAARLTATSKGDQDLHDTTEGTLR